MKNFKTIIILFAFVLVGIAGAAVVNTLLQGEQAKQAEVKYQQYVQKYASQQSAQPKPTPTPTPQAAASAASLNTDLQGLSDDAGKSDFDQLQKDISGL